MLVITSPYKSRSDEFSAATIENSGIRIKSGGCRRIRNPFSRAGAVFVWKPIVGLATIDFIAIYFEIYLVQLIAKLCAYVVSHSAALAGFDIGYDPGRSETLNLPIGLLAENPQWQTRSDLAHGINYLITHVI